MSIGTLLGFAGVVMVAYVVPGPDWMVILRYSARARRRGFLAAAGVQCGLCVHMAAAALGVSTALLHSPVAFTVLKLVGAAYLVFLGGQALWQSWRRRHDDRPAEQPGEEPETEARPARVFRQAFLSNVLNPKAALFFVSVLPQFLDPAGPAAAQVLVLGTLDIGLGVLWWALFVLLTARLSGLMRRSGPRRALDRVTGTALVGLGVTLVATS
ncbi:LysE family translocator [Amycolatopsis australiensis]|uniref:Threonine/homoserine/homoserine lactone efflux protein n=1 Tax=Amycolatopsis australiensis TaxID=546364 RepID=A0A1K1SAV3_9PSEU|nr:LysE family translocator [Amycolatopsis australiensis]SFW81430.1 Threonine/homoserine/homoserine lactone efflux protein [Amycolatopsis australiensis]